MARYKFYIVLYCIVSYRSLYPQRSPGFRQPSTQRKNFHVLWAALCHLCISCEWTVRTNDVIWWLDLVDQCPQRLIVAARASVMPLHAQFPMCHTSENQAVPARSQYVACLPCSNRQRSTRQRPGILSVSTMCIDPSRHHDDHQHQQPVTG